MVPSGSSRQNCKESWRQDNQVVHFWQGCPNEFPTSEVEANPYGKREHEHRLRTKVVQGSSRKREEDGSSHKNYSTQENGKGPFVPQNYSTQEKGQEKGKWPFVQQNHSTRRSHQNN